ncbi:hypothetical protein KP509_01G100800 [Ceratopteris richardii]|uniref:EF-hand domain-containing protein n=1 Tax=Ceratopteris richardii TaxID=49495 RepID=A0A8T2VFP0_CERRI|nr:hypothetical protein KP509_01G100800 [Ceratopteris richardii]
MSKEVDYYRPLLREQDKTLSQPDLTKASDVNYHNICNGKADVVLDIRLGEYSDEDNDVHKAYQHWDSSRFDGELETDGETRETSSSGECCSRLESNNLPDIYSFLGDRPTLGPMPMIDPFQNHTEAIGSLYEWLKVIVCFPLVIARLLLIILITGGGILIAKILLLGWDMNITPMPKWRRRIVYITRILARLVLFCCGYHWIRRLGKPAKREVAPIIVSNHVSFIDPIFFFFELLPSFVSSASHSEVPGLGMIIRPMQVINVERSSAESKKYASKEIKRRAMSNDFPHVMLFPEGTTTNGKALIFFQLGAFTPGLPVQPVVLRYPFVHFDNSWGRISAVQLLWRMLSQLHNFMEVEYLPVIYPSAKEREHPTLFAKKVKHVMAKALNVPSTEHSHGDLILSMKMRDPKENCLTSYMVEMAKMEKLFRITTRESAVLLQKFQGLNTDCSGILTEDQFVEALDFPNTDFLHQIFRFFDKDEEGSISFREDQRSF